MSAAIVACSSAPELDDAVVPDSFSTGGDAELDPRWWLAFEDENLNAVMEHALDHNFTLLAAWERLRAAYAVIKRDNSERLPIISANAGVRAGDAPNDNASIGPFVGAEASWEVDVWGRINQQVRAARNRAEAAEADAHAVAVSVSAEIALTWAQIGAARERLALLERQIQTNENAVRALRERFRAGALRAADILRQQALLESTLEQREDTRAALEVARHRLSVLMGELPQDTVDGPTVLVEPPPLPATGIPGELIERRPDVRREYLLLQAADAELAAASRARLPRITLAASVSSPGGASASEIFREWTTSFAAELFAPLFMGGRLNAEVARTEAVRQELFYAYCQAVLDALTEVEDALIQEERQAEQVRRIEAQIELTEGALRQLEVSFQNGAGGFIDVLLSLSDLQDLRRSLVDARLELVQHRVSLYRALAGPIEDVDLDDVREDAREDGEPLSDVRTEPARPVVAFQVAAPPSTRRTYGTDPGNR